MPGSILVVSAFFTPHRRIGTRRAEKLVTYLAEQGWRVTVLTMAPEHAPPYDSSIEVPASVEVIRTFAFLPRDQARAWSERVRPAPSRGREVSNEPPHNVEGRPVSESGRRALLNRGRGWIKSAAVRALERFEDLDAWTGWRRFAVRAVRGRTFDVVLGTLPPFTAAHIAGDVAHATGARLVLDYRDPWTDQLAVRTDAHFTAAQLARHRAVEDGLLAEASLVLGTSQSMCATLRQRTRAEVAFVPTGFRRQPLGPTSPASPPRLLYAGSLAYGRTLEPILQALARRPPDAAPLELRVCGPDMGLVEQQAAVLGISDRVKLLGLLDLQGAQQEMAQSAAVVVLVAPEWEYSLPGKLFDILESNRPIMLLAPAGADSAGLVDQHQLGWSVTLGDSDSLDSALEEVAQGRSPTPRRMEELSAEHLLALIDEKLRALVR